MQLHGKIVTSAWYAANVGGEHVAVEDAIAGGRLAGTLARNRAGRGLLIFQAARRGRGAALLRRERGALTALVLAALFRGPTIVVLELIPDRPAASAWKRPLKRVWFRLVERPAVRHGMSAGQVLGAGDRGSLARLYGIDAARLDHVPWALCRTGVAPIVPARERAGVLASGRAACDWETLFSAAAGRAWQLVVVCGAGDLERVQLLNADGRAEVRPEITREEHDELMRTAAVFAMPLLDDGQSSGHVRLMTATELGTPVVASAIGALDGYAVDGRTAVLVPPGDAAALGEATDRLLADPARCDELARVALERARARTYPDYFAAVGEMIERALGGSMRSV